MKKFWHRMYCGIHFYRLGWHPIRLIHFLSDKDAQIWCDKLYDLLHLDYVVGEGVVE